MPRLLRPSAAPLSRRRAVVDFVRRLEPRRVLVRLAVGAMLIAFVDVGLAWRSTVIDLGTTTSVATMRHDVSAGSIIADDDVAITDRPRALVPAGALTDAPIGSTARADLVAGEVLVAQRLFPRPDGIDADQRIVGVPTPTATPTLAAGTRVELFGIRALKDGFATPAVRLATGLVVAVDDQSIAVAVEKSAVPLVLEHLAFGVVDVIVRP